MTARSQAETTSETRRAAIPQQPSARTLLVCVNRRAGSGVLLRRLEEVAGTLERCRFTVHLVRDLDALGGIANDLRSSGQLRAAVAVGGDGTASAVRARVPLEVPMLVIPMGTENLLGRYLRQSTDPAAVLDVVENGVVIDLDLGWANGKPFLLMISAGFDAEVIRRLHERRRGNIRRATYLLPVLSAIGSYTFHPMRIYWDTADAAGAESTLCRWLFGFNLPLYALGLPVAPNAVGTDGLLDVCAFQRGSIWSIARYLWHIVRNVHHSLPDTVARRTRRFRIESVDNASIAYQLDGDYGGTLPVNVEVVPNQLRLLVSKQSAQRIGYTLPDEHRT